MKAGKKAADALTGSYKEVSHLDCELERSQNIC